MVSFIDKFGTYALFLFSGTFKYSSYSGPIGRDSMWKWSFTFKRTILRYLNRNEDENWHFLMFWPENSYASSTNPIRTKCEQLKSYPDLFHKISNLDLHFYCSTISKMKVIKNLILYYRKVEKFKPHNSIVFWIGCEKRFQRDWLEFSTVKTGISWTEWNSQQVARSDFWWRLSWGECKIYSNKSSKQLSWVDITEWKVSPEKWDWRSSNLSGHGSG